MNEPTRLQLPAGFVPRGTRLSGIYEIDAPLAKGGMGEVYRGHAILTNEQVAIKLIRADMADNEAALDLFKREATALSRLHHEAIVRYFVFSLDQHLQRHYLAMEFVEGVSLSDLAARGPLPVEAAIGLLKRVASGLHAAHERGVVHRDISPDNIIVEDGEVTHARIIDFGIARSTRVGDGTVIGGGFAGKHNYVSPEQLGFFGGDVTGRSDIYSLGLVIAQCLRGKALDMGGSQVDILEKRRRVPDLAGIDGRVRPLLEKMLQPDPADRPGSMDEIVAMLADAAPVAGKPGPAPRKEPLPRRADRAAEKSGGGLKWAIISLFALVILGAGGFVGYVAFEDEAVRLWEQVAALVMPRKVEPGPAGPDKPPEPGPGPVTPVVPDKPLAPPTAAELMQRYIRNYDGGKCFLAMPVSVTDTSAKIMVFAQDDKPIEKIYADFMKAFAVDPDLPAIKVHAGHCAALEFVNALRRKSGATSANFQITQPAYSDSDVFPELVSGNVLGGSLVSQAANAALLIVNENSDFLDVSRRLSETGPVREFAIPNLRKGPGLRSEQMLLVAIAGGQAIQALRPITGTGKPALFEAALREVEARQGALEVAVRYFEIK